MSKFKVGDVVRLTEFIDNNVKLHGILVGGNYPVSHVDPDGFFIIKSPVDQSDVYFNTEEEGKFELANNTNQDRIKYNIDLPKETVSFKTKLFINGKSYYVEVEEIDNV